MSGETFELTPELLADFHAECEEQFTNIRTQLSVLDSATAAPDHRTAALESLYRSVHSFKGNAGIAGLAGAEQLTHATEGLLRRVNRQELPFDAARLDLVARAVARLEQIVAAFRDRKPQPPIDDLYALLAAEADAPTAAVAEPVDSAPGAALPEAATSPSCRATFRPTSGLDHRGVNVNSVRTRLATVGRILAARPTVEPGSGIRFDFTIGIADPPADIEAWAADGVTWERLAPAKATSNAADGEVGAFFSASSRIVRVDLDRLDELMRIAGELVIHRSRLQERVARMPGDTSSLQELQLGLGRSLRDLRAAIMRVRMVSIVEIFSRLPFVVRDLTRDTDKQVQVQLEGRETEIDKYLVERLREPLLHLVRNAVSHGIESSRDRVAAGKPATATLLLRAATAGDAVEITIRDDGRGIDPEAIAARARAAGLTVPEVLDAPAVVRLLCTPGFSTRDEADRAAGRGVGMAVVDAAIRELGGTLTLSTEPGRFTEFVLRLPLTLSIAETFIVRADRQLCAIPHGAVEEVVQISTDDIRLVNGNEVGPYRGGLLRLIRLRSLFGLEAGAEKECPVLVLKTDRSVTGLMSDRIVGMREVVVRPMQDVLTRVPGVSGATELGDGKPILILDPSSLLEAAMRAPLRRPRTPVAHSDS